ncbi:protein NDNF isoform X1 [Pygocentrus nattereri]|uniref:Protein NDNF n=2 Tax=Pygocentrus nattereri TaxID=42514 RepID=A0A3B4CQP4_PYGNA|nr:protein NDNF isoform X1 [Pygocentrus nattereri]
MSVSVATLTLTLLLSGAPPLSALQPENEVPLRPTAWLTDRTHTPVYLNTGRTRRLYFTVRKKTLSLELTVSPCSGAVEWSLTARSLKDKPAKYTKWSTKKSFPEVWWRGSGMEALIHSYSGSAADTYEGPAYGPASIYILQLKSTEQDTQVDVYLHEGPGPSGAFPELPTDPRVHTLGVGMTSVTLSWTPSPSVTKTSKHSKKHNYKYCVTVNRKHNFRNVCAARKESRKHRERGRKQGRRDKQEKDGGLLKTWQQWDMFEDDGSSAVIQADFADPACVCREVESVCTVSDLLPDTQYYFDVFVIDQVNRTSATYTGTFVHTHTEARGVVTPLRDGQVQWVTLSLASEGQKRFSFRPRGGQQNGLLTLHSCNSTKAKVTVSSRGHLLSSQEVGDQLAQIWLQGGPSYLIQLQTLDTTTTPKLDPERSKVCMKMQASSAFHRRGVPVLPVTLQLKSFNKLRSCSSVTLAWMGTEERSLYCLYQRQISNKPDVTDRCLGPESRPASERVLCKYFQELDPRRAVTTAVIEGLNPGSMYMFDVYLMRRWGLPIKYHSKTVRTRREC